MKNICGWITVFVVFGAVWFGGPSGCGNSSALQLLVTVSGAGRGLVSSSTGGISCKKDVGTCREKISEGKSVTLTAQPDSGFVFAGWSGGVCSGTSTCTFTMDSAKSVQAVFIMIAFSSQKDPKNPLVDAVNPNFTNNIWTIGTDGSSATPLTLLTAAQAFSLDPQWSPDGSKIAFDSNRALDGSDAANNPAMGFVFLEFNIWVVNADGTGATPLTKFTSGSGMAASRPKWSPDGTKLIFISNQNVDGSLTPNPNNTQNIWIINADGTGVAPMTRLTAVNASTGSFGYEFCPDGTKIAFTSARDFNPTVDGSAGTDNIWMMNADGTSPAALTHLTKGLAQHFSPQWSPDSAQISFDSGRSLTPSADDINGPTGVRNVWVVNADGSDQTPLTGLTAVNADCTSARWSPDGKRIAFQSARSQTPTNDATNTNNTSNIWVMDADGGNPHPLTSLTADNSDAYFPQWSPDGTNILFESEQDLNGSGAAGSNLVNNLWIIHEDASHLLPVTTATVTGANSRDGDWDVH